MSRFKNIVLALLVSPEIVVCLSVLGLVVVIPDHIASLGEVIRSDPEVWKYLPALTFIFSGAAINSSFKLRAPLENFSNKVLYRWPAYQLLVDRVYIALFYGICSAGGSLALWVFGLKLEPVWVASVFLAATLMSGVTALTMILAQQKLRELLEANA